MYYLLALQYFNIIFFLHVLPKDSLTGERTVHGVEMEDGTVLTADIILTGCSPYHTFIELLGQDNDNQNVMESDIQRPDNNKDSNGNEKNKNQFKNDVIKFNHHIEHTDFSCGAFKINCAVNKLPDFSCYPSPKDGSVGPMHRGTLQYIVTI